MATVSAIGKARQRANDYDPSTLESTFVIDWSAIRADKRYGSVYAWNADRVFLGQFRSHTKALDKDAAVTKFMGVWFIWDDEL